MFRGRLLAFFLITFGISWGIPGLALVVASLTGAFEVSLRQYSPLSYLVIWAPAISAFMVIGTTQGRVGIRAFVGRLLHWRVSWVWYVVVILGLPFMIFMAAVLTEALGRPALVAPTVPISAFLLGALLTGTEGPFEEFGWRGFALPLLQRRYSGLRSAVILGIIWGVWHVPGLFVETVMTGAFEGQMLVIVARLLVGITAKSIIMTVIYNGTGGSIPLMFVYHWLGNLAYPWEARAGIFPMQDVLNVVVAAVLVVALGRRYLGRENLHTEITPGVNELPLADCARG
jgi:membrane protease YdiL (CAAX protease family)